MGSKNGKEAQYCCTGCATRVLALDSTAFFPFKKIEGAMRRSWQLAKVDLLAPLPLPNNRSKLLTGSQSNHASPGAVRDREKSSGRGVKASKHGPNGLDTSTGFHRFTSSQVQVC
jgi:hypothetical protein